MSKKFQNGFEVYRDWLSNIKHNKQSNQADSLDNYVDLGGLNDSNASNGEQ